MQEGIAIDTAIEYESYSPLEMRRFFVRVRNSRDVGPRFHGMSVQHFTRCRPGISRHVGPAFHGMSVQFVR
jgi:hypothetical protein